MEYSLLKKPQPGDLFWWDNPLEKGSDYDTHLLCGRRPVLIINIMRSGFQFIPCTSAVKAYRQIQLVGKNNPNIRYNLKDLVITETDESRLANYIGQVTPRTLDFIKSQIGANIINPYIPSSKASITLNVIPLGRLVRTLDGEYYVITNRIGFNDMTAVPCVITTLNNEEDLYLVDEAGTRYKVCFDRVCRLRRFDEEFELLNSVSEGILQFLNWKIQDAMIGKQQKLQSKLSTLADELDKLILENNQLKSEIGQLKANNKKKISTGKKQSSLQIDLLKGSMSHSLGENDALAALLRGMVEESEEVNEIPQTLAPSEEEISKSEDTGEDVEVKTIEDNIEDFIRYFKPVNRGRILKEITSKDDIIDILSESSAEYIQRTGKTYLNWYYLRNLVIDSIDWSQAPQEIYEARFNNNHFDGDR